MAAAPNRARSTSVPSTRLTFASMAIVLIGAALLASYIPPASHPRRSHGGAMVCSDLSGS
jgi:hypothetical protein